MRNWRVITIIMVLFLSGCVSDRSETSSRSSSYHAPFMEEGVLTYGITSDYGKEVTWSANYSLRTEESRKRTYQFPRGDGPPVRLEFVEDRAKINVSDLNVILTHFGIPTVSESIFETPDLHRPSYARYLFDWDTPGVGRLSLEVVLCVCRKQSITECPQGTTNRMGSKYYYCLGKLEHMER